MDSTTPTSLPPEVAAAPPAPRRPNLDEPDLVIQDLDTTHDRQTTPTSGTVRRGRWFYPARVFDGVTQYQTRAGEWMDLPLNEADPEQE